MFSKERPISRTLMGFGGGGEDGTNSQDQVPSFRFNNLPVLDQVALTLVATNQARDMLEAIQIIEKNMTLANGKQTLRAGDFNGADSLRSLKQSLPEFKFERSDVQQRKIEVQGETRKYGTIGHAAALRLLSGQLPVYDGQQSLQPRLFEEQQPAQLDLPWQVERREGRLVLQEPHYEEIASMCRELEGTMSDLWASESSRAKLATLHLRDLLYPIFGRYVEAISTDRTLDCESGEYFEHFPRLYRLTLLTWAQVAMWSAQQDTRCLFGEVSVFPGGSDIGVGRMDALEVVSINGVSPNERQRVVLQRVSQNRFTSVGHLVKVLRRTFGEKLGLRILDLKFAVGDGVPVDNIITPESLSEPLSQHVDQVGRYQACSAVDMQLSQGVLPQDITWGSVHPFLDPQIVYLLPQQQPLVHTVHTDGDVEREYFIRNVVRKLERAHAKAQLRVHADLLNKLMNGKQAPSCLQLKFPEVSIGSAREVAESLREYGDPPYNTFEIVGTTKTGRSKYQVHLNRMIDAVNSGEIDVGRGDLESGRMFVRCTFPDHADAGSPSEYIDLEEGVVYCFGCKRGGPIVPSSIPEGLKITVPELDRGRPKYRRTREAVEIPDQLDWLMRRVWEHTQDIFFDSKATEYLRGRYIDPDFAHSQGAGFFDLRVLARMVRDVDMDLEKLATYGIIRYSHSISPQDSVAWLLQEMGMKIGEISRPVKHPKTKQQVPGLPFCQMINRVTAPMDFYGMATNVYGRASWERVSKSGKHRKFLTRHTQGAYNHQILAQDRQRVIITEGVMDAWSMPLLGLASPDEVMSIVGIGNNVMLEAIARANPKTALWFALDIDEKTGVGEKQTIRWEQDLRALGFKGQIVNMTAEIAREYPGVTDDYNQWLVARKGRPLT